jgi:hypothetical protein
VKLFRADRYKESAIAWWEYQGEEGWFEFLHLAPGEYVLVFNNDNEVDPDSPFPRTFYPGTSSLATAQHIVLREGEQFVNADIHLRDGYPTQEVAVHVRWEGEKPSDPIVFVEAKPSHGDRPHAYEVAPDTYSLSLLKDARYTIHASQWCGSIQEGNVFYGAGSLETNTVIVDGADERVPEITLVFPASGCEEVRKQKLKTIKARPQDES